MTHATPTRGPPVFDALDRGPAGTSPTTRTGQLWKKMRELLVGLLWLPHTHPMTTAGPSARRALLPRLLVALASAAALSVGLLVVVISPRADAEVPLTEPVLVNSTRGPMMP